MTGVNQSAFFECGSVSMYRKGCRCRPCKDAKAKSLREYHGRKEGRLILSHKERKEFKLLWLLVFWARLYRRERRREYWANTPKETRAAWMRAYRTRQAEKVGRNRTPGRRNIDWERYRDQLGKHADSHLAAEIGVSIEGVAYARKKFGIPAFDVARSIGAKRRGL